MSRKKPLRAMFVDHEGRISIQQLTESRPRLMGLVHGPWVRTGFDRKRGTVIYEERQPEMLTTLASAYRTQAVAANIKAALKTTRELQTI